jgi:glycosyltransferase involved in cell wall biosynthesis
MDMVAALRQAAANVSVHVVLGETGPLLSELQQAHVSVEVVPMPRAIRSLGESQWHRPAAQNWSFYGRWSGSLLRAAWALPAYVHQLRQAVVRQQPHIIHSTGLKCHLLTRWLTTPTTRIIWHLRDFLLQRRVMKFWLSRATRPPHVLIANSHAVADQARQLFPRTPVEMIYNGIDTTYFSPEGPTCRELERTGNVIASPPLRIGLVATYAYWKGQDVFLRAAARLLAAGINTAQFYIIGGPIYHTPGSQWSQQQLQYMIQQLQLSHYCHLIPFQHDMAAVYRSLDIVVHASVRPEPFGRTVAEAMACGRAVIVSAAGGAAELFMDGHDALGVPPGDVDSLTAALRRLIDDIHLRQRLAATARQTAVARFDRSTMAQRLLQVYRSLVTPHAD